MSERGQEFVYSVTDHNWPLMNACGPCKQLTFSKNYFETPFWNRGRHVLIKPPGLLPVPHLFKYERTWMYMFKFEKSRGKIFPKNASRNLNWRFSKQFLWSFDVRCILRFLFWNVTENVCISRTDDYAIIFYILVALAFLEPIHIFFWSCLKTLLTVAWFRNVLERGFHWRKSYLWEGSYRNITDCD